MSNFRRRPSVLLGVVTQQGGFTRADQRLDLAVQTLGTPVRELEKSVDAAR